MFVRTSSWYSLIPLRLSVSPTAGPRPRPKDGIPRSGAPQPDFRLRSLGHGHARPSVGHAGESPTPFAPAGGRGHRARIPADRRFYLIDEADALFDATDHGALLRIVSDYDPATERLRLTFPDGAVVEDGADVTGDPVTTDFWGGR